VLTYVKDNDIITVVESQIVNLETPCLVNGECSPTTTTTTTLLDCSFTGTAIQLPDTTTTTTTTVNPCPDCVPGNVTIGTQTWAGCNLDVTTFRNGDPIPEITDVTAWSLTTSPAWCYFNNLSSNGDKYGKLYNWYAVNDPRGLAPTGYHIPTDAEFATLSTFLGGDSVSGGAMKEDGACYWQAPNTDATNSSGFTGLPGGQRLTSGGFNSINFFGLWWSSSEVNSSDAINRVVSYNSGSSSFNTFNKGCGHSVRVLQD